jgi:hypothetical protein
VEQHLSEVYGCPDIGTAFAVSGEVSGSKGYFRFGQDLVCYGSCSSGDPANAVTDPLFDARKDVKTGESSVVLPFDPLEIVDNLRYERYVGNSETSDATPAKSAVRAIYYAVRPLMGVAVRKHLQRLYLRDRQKTPFPQWPVDATVERLTERLLLLGMKAKGIDRVPFVWFWPDGAKTCTTISHDVEAEEGLQFIPKLMDLNDSFGVKTSFQIVPEKRYTPPEKILQLIQEREFEVNVHDLNHDGHLFREHEEFLRRAKRINQYAKKWGARGFRSAVMYRNADWFGALDFSYDMSLPNVAHLDPQRGGCCTVLPFFIGKILEIPVTMTQDYTLFHILKDYSLNLWKDQIDCIREHNGLVSIIIHPDYIIEERARGVYKDLLAYICDLASKNETWIARPGEVDEWWRLRSALHLVGDGNQWRIEGDGSERAKIAWAVVDGDRLRYEFDSAPDKFLVDSARTIHKRRAQGQY